MNSVTLIGNLTRDPELSYTPRQTAKCQFTLAINRPRRNGEDQGADYIRVVVWGRQAENCDRYLAKGRKVAVSGSIRTGSYKNKNGDTVYTTDVWANNVEFLNTQTQQASRPQEQYKAPEYTRTTPKPPAERQMNMADMPPEFDAVEEDVPF